MLVPLFKPAHALFRRLNDSILSYFSNSYNSHLKKSFYLEKCREVIQFKQNISAAGARRQTWRTEFSTINEQK